MVKLYLVMLAMNITHHKSEGKKKLKPLEPELVMGCYPIGPVQASSLTKVESSELTKTQW